MVLINDDFFKNTAWQLSRAGSFVAAPVIRFRDHGILGGFVSKWERCWELRGSSILFQDISGVTSTRFEITEQDEQSAVKEMRGRSLVFPTVEHVLTRISMPSLDTTDFSLDEQGRDVVTVKKSSRRRKNLVVIRAGKSSLHKQWARYISAEDRNWDLCVSWYGTELPADIDDADYFYHQQKDRKFSAIANLFLKEQHLLEYENYWFPDDDLETSWRDINRLFNIFRRMRLELAQPALTGASHSFVNHLVTAQNPDYFLRYCDFVELMCPLLSNELLRLCIPAFRGTTTAFCLDHIWGGLQGRVPGRIAIIDDVAVAHTRPMAANYDPAEAMDEGNRLAALFCIEGSYSVLGGIRREERALL